MQVMRRIVDDHWQVTFPPYLSPEAKDLVSRLLERRPARRIGAALCCAHTAVWRACEQTCAAWSCVRVCQAPGLHAGMLNGRANDIKNHKWFEGLDWTALEARRLEPPRRPKDDSAKRINEMNEADPNEPKPEEDPAELAECEVVFANF